MSIAKWLKENITKYPDRESLIAAAMAAKKKSRKSVVSDIGRMKHIATPVHKFKGSSLGFTEKEIRARHDSTFKIRAGCKKLPKGRYFTDHQMRDYCNIPASLWKEFSRHEEFDIFKIRLSSKDLYWGAPKSVEKLKGDLYVS